jgi:hypothetical protein
MLSLPDTGGDFFACEGLAASAKLGGLKLPAA